MGIYYHKSFIRLTEGKIEGFYSGKQGKQGSDDMINDINDRFFDDIWKEFKKIEARVLGEFMQPYTLAGWQYNPTYYLSKRKTC